MSLINSPVRLFCWYDWRHPFDGIETKFLTLETALTGIGFVWMLVLANEQSLKLRCFYCRWNKPTMTDFLGLSVGTRSDHSVRSRLIVAQWLASTASGLIMAADLMMTIVLIWFLRRNHTGVTRYVFPRTSARQRTRSLTAVSHRTDSILDILILYAVSSGEFLERYRAFYCRTNEWCPLQDFSFGEHTCLGHDESP